MQNKEQSQRVAIPETCFHDAPAPAPLLRDIKLGRRRFHNPKAHDIITYTESLGELPIAAAEANGNVRPADLPVHPDRQ